MIKALKKALAVVLTLAMLLSIASVPIFADTLDNNNTNENTIRLAIEFSEECDRTAPVTSVEAGDNFTMWVTFDGNPTTLADSIQAYDMLIGYDSSKISFPYGTKSALAGLTSPTFNPAFADGVMYAGWASDSGIVIGRDVQASGLLFQIDAKATTALTAEDLEEIKFIAEATNSAGIKQTTQLLDGSKNMFNYVQVPTLEGEEPDTPEVPFEPEEPEGNVINLAIEFSAVNDRSTPVTSVAAGTEFTMWVTFAGNPTELAESIQAYDLLIGYDSAKISFPYGNGSALAGLTTPTFNHAFADGVMYAGWASDSGIVIGRDVQASGLLFQIDAKATTALTAEDLEEIKFIAEATNSAGLKQKTQLLDGNKNRLTCAQVPTLEGEEPGNDTNSKTIDLSLAFSSDAKGQNSITSVEAGETFYMHMNFAGNPVSTKGITGYALLLAYSQDKITIESRHSGLTYPTFNSALTNGAMYAAWGSSDGIVNDNGVVVSEGTLFKLKVTAKIALTKYDLARIGLIEKTIASYGEYETKIINKYDEEFAINWVSTLGIDDRTLIAKEGYIYTNGETFGYIIHLGIYDSADNHWEITEEEYRNLINGGGEKTETIELAIEFSAYGNRATPVTSVEAGTEFTMWVTFAGNPTDLASSIQAYDMLIGYDAAKISFPWANHSVLAGLTYPTFNPAFADGVMYAGWASDSGIVVGRDIQESGVLFQIDVKATTALTAEDLEEIKFIAEATSADGKKQTTQLLDGNKTAFNYVQVPTLEGEEPENKTIELAIEFTEFDDRRLPVTSVEKGDEFTMWVTFSGNPTTLEDSIQAYDLLISYNPNKIEFPYGNMSAIQGEYGLTSPTFNHAFANGVMYAGWADSDGIVVDRYIRSSGVLFQIDAVAATDLTAADLLNIEFITEATSAFGNKQTTKLIAGNMKEFNYVQIPMVDEGVEPDTPDLIEIKESYFTFDLSDIVYTGSAITPAVISILSAGTDYYVAYSNNVNVGTATITVKGIGNYKGTITKTFRITAKAIQDGDGLFAFNLSDREYVGSVIKPAVTSTKLTAGTDYTVTYTDNVNVGTATITVKGIGNYKGTIVKNFNILAKPIGYIDFTFDLADKVYTGSAIEPTVTSTIIAGTDYEVTYFNNTEVGTAEIIVTGIGNYKGTIHVIFNIIPKEEPEVPQGPTINLAIEFSEESVRANSVTSVAAGDKFTMWVTFDGNPTELANSIQAYDLLIGFDPAKVSLPYGKQSVLAGLTSPTFNHAFANGVMYAGWASDSGIVVGRNIAASGLLFQIDAQAVTDLTADDLRAIGFVAEKTNTAGVKQTTQLLNGAKNKFNYIQIPTVEESDIPVVITADDFTFDLADKVYTGSAIEPAVTSALVEGTDYEVAYTNNTEVGTAEIIVTGIGNYKGTITKTFKIVAKAPEINKGDIDSNGKITIDDVITVLQFIAEIYIPTDVQRVAADWDGNGYVEINDALYILQKVAGLI